MFALHKLNVGSVCALFSSLVCEMLVEVTNITKRFLRKVKDMLFVQNIFSANHTALEVLKYKSLI